jgi:hypothetical protein
MIARNNRIPPKVNEKLPIERVEESICEMPSKTKL